MKLKIVFQILIAFCCFSGAAIAKNPGQARKTASDDPKLITITTTCQAPGWGDVPDYYRLVSVIKLDTVENPEEGRQKQECVFYFEKKSK